ncbi:response regulator [Cellulophaga sp. HaHa_2_95]|uniref:ATP-binding protein n=1 Tax=Cellulophaga sp. HaHa_2_95 TaxID=2745558 RepID=UPI001C4EF56D|nr:ATP-binding protein [Cellulophaga sp. HaHa_2_95]QXP54423.1 response regulator [Cellulophaga sp. HaHa_2_95]
MKSNELLSYISDLESKLNSFSFEELTSDEAVRLKNSFQAFKEKIEAKTQNNERLDSVRKVKSLNGNPKKRKKVVSTSNEEQLIARVSHEIRTPLNGIVGFTELLSESSLTEDQSTHVQAIKGASNTLLNLINELLEYSKLTSGTAYFESVDFNFHNIVNDVCYLCETLIVNPKIDFNVTYSEAIPENLIGDPSKLSQVLLNLIGNAIKFVEVGSIHLAVDVVKKSKSKVVLGFSVTDTGIGIAADKLTTIFDYYKQASDDTQKNYGGTGLGLSIVKHIIASLNGEISVASKLGVGTTFNFSLPYEIGQPKDFVSNVLVDEEILEQERQVGKLNILVFEDNTMNQKLIQNRLNNWGCSNFITDDLTEGIAILEHYKIDVILMDLRMPVTSGYIVAKVIREHQNDRIKNLPIIALTADFSIKDKNLCAATGINDYLLKPFDSKVLLQKITKNTNTFNQIDPMKSPQVISKINAVESCNVNLSDVIDDCLGEVEMLEELVMLFKQNIVEFIGKTKVDLKNADIKGVQFNTHKIKAGLRIMRTDGLLRIAEQMHKVCLDDQDFKYLNFLFDCFVKEYPVIESEIATAIAAFKKDN